MRIAVRQATASEKCILQRLLELNAHDWSEFDRADVDAHGVFGYSYLEAYREEPGRYPFHIQARERYAGFVLVNRHCIVMKERDAKSIAEFLCCGNTDAREWEELLQNEFSTGSKGIGK